MRMEDFMWVKLCEGKFTNNGTGAEIPGFTPGTILKAIKGGAGDEPPKVQFICLEGDRYIRVCKETARIESEQVLDRTGLFNKGRAVTNNGGAWFTENGTFEL